MFGQTWIDSTRIWIAAPRFQMERPTFFRAADDLDLMAPLSDLSDDDLAPCAARSMALMAKKRGLSRSPGRTRSTVRCVCHFLLSRCVAANIFGNSPMNFTHAAWEPENIREPDIAESSGKVQGNAYGLILVSRLQIQRDLDCATGSVLWWVSLRKMLGLVSVGRSCSSQGVGMRRAISLPESDTLWTHDVIWIDMSVVSKWSRTGPEAARGSKTCKEWPTAVGRHHYGRWRRWAQSIRTLVRSTPCHLQFLHHLASLALMFHVFFSRIKHVRFHDVSCQWEVLHLFQMICDHPVNNSLKILFCSTNPMLRHQKLL